MSSSQRSKPKKRSSGIGTPNTSSQGKPAHRKRKDTKLPLALGVGANDSHADIDVGTDSTAPPATTPTSIVSGTSDPNEGRLKCPCNHSDKTSSYVVCTGCLQEWHQNCANLIGLTPGAILKLLTWLCPRCFESPYAPSTPPPCDDPIKEFFLCIKDIKKCNEELHDSTSQVEWFNLHVKKLILDDEKFVNYSTKIDSLVSVMNVLNKKLGDAQVSGLSDDTIAKSLNDITEKVAFDSSCLNDNVATSLKSSEKAIKDLSDQNQELKHDLTKKLAELQEALAAERQPPPTAPSPATSETDPFLQSINERLDSIMKDQFDLKQSIGNQQPRSRSPPASSPSASPRRDDHRTPDRPRFVLSTNPTDHMEETRAEYVDKELSVELFEFLNSSDAQLTRKNGRSVGAYGEPYSYPGSGPAKKTALPPPVKCLIDKINIEFPGANINSCVINRYSGPSSSLPEHSDDEPCLTPGSSIYTVSLGSPAAVIYRDLITKVEKSALVEDRSLYVMSQKSQLFWTHRIDPPTDNADYIRISITLRSVSMNNLHSTILLGDSNTKYIHFEGDVANTGSGTRSTFGPKLPGKKVPTFHISQIDPLKCIGYQNIILHVGINDFNPRSKGRAVTDPNVDDVHSIFGNFVDKIERIKAYCPKSKLVISPILPTKLDTYNRRALKFNSMLFKYSDKFNDIKTLDFNSFLDFGKRYLDNSHGSYLNPSDPIHLGRMGVQNLAGIFKSAIFRNMVDGRSYNKMVTNRVYRSNFPPLA